MTATREDLVRRWHRLDRLIMFTIAAMFLGLGGLGGSIMVAFELGDITLVVRISLAVSLVIGLAGLAAYALADIEQQRIRFELWGDTR